MGVHLITGVGGFVASYLARYLISRGLDVVGTVRWNEDLSRIEDLDIKTIPMRLTDSFSCLRCIRECKPDYIYHLAAETFVDDSFRSPLEIIKANIEGTTNIFESIRFLEYDPIIYVASSSEVYGDVNEVDVPITEGLRFEPQNVYGCTKAAVDHLAGMYYRSYGLKIICTRWFTHTGPGRTMMSAENSFARQIALIEAGKQEPVVSVGNLNSIRTMADVRDAVRGIYLAIQKCTPGEVYNIGGNKIISVGDILDYLISLSPMEDDIIIKVDPALMRKADVTLQIPNTTKFREATGWEPEIPFETMMADILNFWRDKIAKYKM